jgi:hypothetical protein
MTTEDFSQLAKIYGADIKRWPEEYRSMIGDLAATQFTTMRQILDEELALDALLSQDSIVPASSSLMDNIIQGAPRATATKNRTYSWQDNRWLSNLFKTVGFTGIGLAGAVTGVIFVSIMSSHLMGIENTNNELTVAEMVDFGQDWR